MSNEIKIYEIFNILKTMFPNAHCELNYHNVYELTIAVMLSAQTTDKAVNLVTPSLFDKYPTIFDLSKANPQDVEIYIKRIGLYHNKAINIVKMAKQVVEQYNGVIPSELEKLKSLPGIGQKTANVILVEYYKIPRIPVDTHVERVSKRLGIVNSNATVLEVENKLMELLKKEDYHLGHHLFLFLGRYHCLSRNPKCDGCPLMKYCSYFLTKTP